MLRTTAIRSLLLGDSALRKIRFVNADLPDDVDIQHLTLVNAIQVSDVDIRSLTFVNANISFISD